MDALGDRAHLELRASSVYETRPVGPSTSPFLNAVIALNTTSPTTPRDVLTVLHRIEHEHGRQREVRWGARTLDLDLLAYRPGPDEPLLEQRTANLELPHPRIADRDFVLAPLAEIDPDLELPGWGRVTALLERLPPESATLLRRFDWPPSREPSEPG